MVLWRLRDQSAGEEHVYAYSSSLDGETWLVILNHSDQEQSYRLPASFADRTMMPACSLVIWISQLPMR
ncbi:alpha-glucosidase C-terminal domain-containing protein [Paenibacillus pabuli]|uniref:alpha-glucosidase C-terminal domain-containing protein n=1 Tax=Paenibacillus pabuli TaxID=1472 RepID=UPI000781EE0D|nr:alpha-glucosidase C-terminal domain-containing protein [Paenibacillus pabuli]MEC0125896.1 alpha-glucosidase C-terminal domain-containing protein [Paenibacillus pabuli]